MDKKGRRIAPKEKLGAKEFMRIMMGKNFKASDCDVLIKIRYQN